MTTQTRTIGNPRTSTLVRTLSAFDPNGTIPNNLTVAGSITVSKGGSGNVVMAAGSGVTLDLPGGLTTLTLQYSTMAAILWGSLTHYRLEGAQA